LSEARRKFVPHGRMAELAYALALGANGATLGGATPLPPTLNFTISEIQSVLGERKNRGKRFSEPSTMSAMHTKFSVADNAGVAQLVERNLAKVDVTGPNPASRLLFATTGAKSIPPTAG
jgi:hypothetical protein